MSSTNLSEIKFGKRAWEYFFVNMCKKEFSGFNTSSTSCANFFFQLFLEKLIIHKYKIQKLQSCDDIKVHVDLKDGRNTDL